MFILLCCLALVTTKAVLKNLDLLALQPGEVTSLYGPSPDNFFGNSVSSAGDFNGDGIDDIIIGACQATNSFSGASYLIFGKKGGIADLNLASLTPTQGFKILGPNIGDSTGYAVTKVGDVNADDLDDIIIGAINTPTSGAGAVYVLFGTRDLITTFIIDPTTLQSSGKGFTIYGGDNYDYLGNAVSWAGDVNDDGIDDIIVGAYQADDGSSLGVGKAYVVFGQVTPMTDIVLASGLSGTLGFTIKGSFSNYLVGMSVSGAGDFNGDGISDIIVGALCATGSLPGSAYIIFGKVGLTDIDVPAGLSNTQGVKIDGATIFDYTGYSVSGLGDVNGDGLDDILIGAPNANPLTSGAVYVVFGTRGAGFDLNLATTSLRDNNLGFTIYGAETENRLGFMAKEAGDINGDGLKDIAIATLASGPMGSIPMATAYIIFGDKSGALDVNVSSLDNNRGIIIHNVSLITSGVTQTAISNAGDVDADGTQDLIIGCPYYYNITDSIYGSAYILYGIPTPEPNNALQGLVDAENFGTAVGRIIAMAASLFHSASIIPLWFVFLEEILQYPKYLLIEYPPRLQNIYDEPGFQLFSIPGISQIPDQLENNIPNYSLPEKFEEYGFDSSFLSNFWNSLMTLLIIIVLIVIAIIADHCFVTSKTLHPLCNKIKYRLKWSYIISIFTGMFCDIALYTSFELRTVKFNGAIEWISFFLCICANLAVLALSIKIVLIIKKFARGKVYSGQNPRKRLIRAFKDEFKSYEVVFQGFKDQTLKQQSYFLLFSLRFYLFYMIIGYLFEHTLVQAILVNLIGVATLLYLAFVRPFTEKLDFIVSLSQELALELIHFCVFLFALDDQLSFASQGFRVVLGDIILACNGAFMGVNLIYSFILALVLLKGFYSWISAKCKQNKTKPTIQSPVSSGKEESRTPPSNEEIAEMDKVNESQIYLNKQSIIEQEASKQRTNINQQKRKLNVLNTSIFEARASQIPSTNTIEDEYRPKFLNPRREERKRVDIEQAAAEYQTTQNRLNQLKRKITIQASLT